MAKAKEGRRRMSRLDMSSEAGRQLFHDLRNPAISKISPLLESDYQSQNFWKSRPEFQQVPFGAFRQQASEMAKIVRAQMTQKAKEEEERRIATEKSRIATPKKETNSIEEPIANSNSCSKPQQDKNIQIQSLRDTIVAPHPNGEMAIIIFEIDGDTDESACQLQFAMKGQKIKVYCRIPSELTDAVSLLGKVDSRNSIQDADCMLLDLAIKRRLEGSRKDSNGNYWEIREVIDLPFPCKESFFNKHRMEIPSYLLRKNEHGYAWGYFWVIGSHIGQKDEGPTTIRCQAASDSESDTDHDENRSQLFSSDEDLDDDSDNMEVEFESYHAAKKKQSTTDRMWEDDIVELKQSLEMKTQEARTNKAAADACINDRIVDLETCLAAKNDELKKLRDETSDKIIKLRQLLEAECKRNATLEAECKEMAELSQKMSLLEQELNENKAIAQTLTDLQAKQNVIEVENQRCYTERDNLLRQIREYEQERQRLLQENCALASESRGYKDEVKKVKELKANEKGNQKLLESAKKNIYRLESQMDRLIVENQTALEAKDNEIEELKKLCQGKDQEHLSSQHIFNENVARMTQETAILAEKLHVTNERMVMLDNEAIQNSKSLNACLERLQMADELLREKEQQNIHHFDQINILKGRVIELEKVAMEKDSIQKNQEREICGLKNHLSQQAKYIKRIEREAERLRKSQQNIRLTPGLVTEEEKKVEFGDLNRWDSEKAMESDDVDSMENSATSLSEVNNDSQHNILLTPRKKIEFGDSIRWEPDKARGSESQDETNLNSEGGADDHKSFDADSLQESENLNFEQKEDNDDHESMKAEKTSRMESRNETNLNCKSGANLFEADDLQESENLNFEQKENNDNHESVEADKTRGIESRNETSLNYEREANSSEADNLQESEILNFEQEYYDNHESVAADKTRGMESRNVAADKTRGMESRNEMNLNCNGSADDKNLFETDRLQESENLTFEGKADYDDETVEADKARGTESKDETSLNSEGGAKDQKLYEADNRQELEKISDKGLTSDDAPQSEGANNDILLPMMTECENNVLTERNKNDSSSHAEAVVEHDQKMSKKRKSCTDLQDFHPVKRLRKSRRLEEKRLAKELKPKVD